MALSESLATESTLEAALTRYEQRRVVRANEIARASRRLGAVAQWSNPVAAWIRDLAMSRNALIRCHQPGETVDGWRVGLTAEEAGSGGSSDPPDHAMWAPVVST